MRGRTTASVALSLVLHGAIARYVALRRPPPVTIDRDRTIEVTTFAASRPRAAAVPLIIRRPTQRSQAADAGARQRPSPAPVESPVPALDTETHAPAINLFAAEALARAMTPPPSDPGGHLRRATDLPATRNDERETVAARVHEMAADAVARERASSGNVAPRWREIERKLAQGFHPPLAAVKQESVAKAFAHQVLRSWLDGEPRVGTVQRGVDASVETLLGTPPGFNIRSMPGEQALAVQARWGAPATGLRVEIEVTLDEEGRVTSARVIHPSGRRLFDRTALTAVEDAVRAGGAPEEHRVVVTRWLVEAAVAVAPPTSIGFRFDETGNLNPGATGWRKYLGPTYPLQQSIQSHVSLIAIEPQR